MKRTVLVVMLMLATPPAPGGAQTPAPPAPQAAPQKIQLAAYLLRAFDGVQRNIVEGAEKMPEEHYAFRPTAETRPFGQVVAHIALSRMGACSAFAGKDNPHADAKEDQPRTKAELLALLKEGSTLCSAAFTGLTDESLTQFVKITTGPAPVEVAKGVMIAGETSHGNEVYGTMAVYLRLKGLVPPSTARQGQRRQ